MNLSIEQVRQLAELDRKMDAGEQPYVTCDQGHRWAFDAELLAEAGVVSGQRCGHAVIHALLQLNLAHIESLIAIEKAQKGAG